MTDRIVTSTLAQLLTSAIPGLSQVHTAMTGWFAKQQAEHTQSTIRMQAAEIGVLRKSVSDLQQRGTSTLGSGAGPGAVSPTMVYVDHPVPFYVPFVIDHRAGGSFHINVVNKHRAAQGRVRGWSAKLRDLEAERARRLNEPAAGDGPGTQSWLALMDQITATREGLRTAGTELLSKDAADSLVDAEMARALPLVAASAPRQAPPPQPATTPRLGPQLGPRLPSSAPPAPAPAPERGPAMTTEPADVAGICQSYQDGLTAGLSGAY